MDSRILSAIVNVLEDKGVIVLTEKEKVISVSCTDTSADFGYSVSNGEFNDIHFKKDNFELTYKLTGNTSVFSMTNNRQLSTLVTDEDI